MPSEIAGYVLPTKAEILNDAIMSGQAAIIIEGITDIQLYRGIADQMQRDTVLRPVELIQGFGEGCAEVVRLFEEFEDTAELRPFIRGNVVGVIDKDVRDFRNEMPENDSVFILKNYSIESHYVCNAVLTRCLVDSTYAPQDGRLSTISNSIYQGFPQSYEYFYLASVEALRAALEPDYVAEYHYSDGFGRLKDVNLLGRLDAKRTAIVAYADNLGLDDSIDSLKLFAKGKALLDCYCSSIKIRIDALRSVCGTDEVPHCEYCASGVNNKCCYRVKVGVTEASLKNAILGQLPISELNYIIDGLNDLLKLEAA